MSPSEADRAAETTEVTVIGEGPKGREEERRRGGAHGDRAGWERVGRSKHGCSGSPACGRRVPSWRFVSAGLATLGALSRGGQLTLNIAGCVPGNFKSSTRINSFNPHEVVPLLCPLADGEIKAWRG